MANDAEAKEILIQGLTRAGRVFRPSDWAERLCGVMSSFRPEGSASLYAHLGYSPYVRPTQIEDVKGVIVDTRLKDIDPRALEFVLGFAKDNDLVTIELSLPGADDPGA